MSKDKKPLLGPDGEPLDLEKYRPSEGWTMEIGGEPVKADNFTFTFKSILGGGSWFTLPISKGTEGKPKKKPALRAAVERDLTALHKAAPADWKGHTEVPPIPAEQSDTYAAAFTSARKNCPHENSHSTLYARHERQCDDCGRYFTRSDW